MSKNSLKNRLTTLLTFICCLSAIFGNDTAVALDSRKAITQYVHDVWQAKEGLPQQTIYDIAQTRDGFLWLGTQEGLVRFDGVRFTAFNKQNTIAIKHNDIRRLCAARDGGLWIATQKGLIRFKDGAFTAFTTKDGLSSDAVSSIFEDHTGTLWIGTVAGELNRFNDGKFTGFPNRKEKAGSGVSAICEDQDGSIWVGTRQNGLRRFKDGVFASVTTKEGLPSDGVSSLYESSDGTLWVGTTGGLTRLKDGKFVVYTTADGLSDNQVVRIVGGVDGGLWIGTASAGLNRFQDGKFTTYTTKEGLTGNVVMALLEDREGSLWVGLVFGGLNRFKDGNFTAYTSGEGLAGDEATSVCASRDGGLWIGTHEGLNHFKDGKVTTYTTKDGAFNDYIQSVFEDRAGSVWIGTLKGLERFRGGAFTIYTTKEGLTNNEVRAIYEDRKGKIWIGTVGGLNLFEDGKLSSIPELKQTVSAILERQDGSLWFGARNGLVELKDGKITTHTTQNGLSENRILALYEDAQASLWIGTYGGGLNRLKDGKFTAYAVRNGLFDDNVFVILEDSRNNLWMSCNRGVFSVSKKELEDFAAGKSPSISSNAYDTSDGLKSSEANGGVQPAGWQTRDGKLWFATSNGVAMIDPAHLRRNELPPPMVIEQVIADKKTLALDGLATLLPGTKEVEVHYTALSFLDPLKVKFKYKLEGFDKDWVDAGTRRVAYYTNLSPGNYRFRVMASNNDGVWNETGVAFEFYLKPHFYQTVWFYVLCVLAVILSGFVLYRFRVKQLRRRTQELESIVDQRTQQLRLTQEKILKLEKQATEQIMAGGFAHEMRNALAGPKLVVDRVLALDGPEPHVSLNLANCKNLKEIYLELKDKLPNGETQLILSKMQTIFSNEEQLDEVLQLVRKATNRGLKITQQIMDYSKIGQQQPGQQNVDLNDLIHNIVKESQAELSRYGVVVEYKRCELPLFVTGHETHFYSVFKNIIINAKDALIDPGLEAGTDRYIQISTAQEGNTCKITIADSGVGIPQDNLAKIFEPFFSTKPATGTGLGLGMVKNIISLYHGSIDVSSEVGNVTTFIISLPATSQERTFEAAA